MTTTTLSRSAPLPPLTHERWRAMRHAVAPRAPRTSWLAVLGITLLGYSMLGKGWAYVGLPPYLFVGEIVLLVGIAVVIRRGRFSGLIDSATFLAIAALGLWGACRTIPFVKEYGADALRDAALWGYSAFAVVVYGYLMADPKRIATVLRYFRLYCFVFLPAVPFIWIMTRYLEDYVPKLPWAQAVPIIDAKGGDVLAHVAGILAFWVSGLTATPPVWRVVVLAGSVAAIGAYNRGGLVAVVVVFTFCAMMRPAHRSLWRLAGAALFALLVLAVTDLRVTIPGKDRELSFNQVVMNITSVFEDDGESNLSGTKAWRLNWWGDIIDYTVFGPYFWQGKGYGINLADDDGYQGTQWEGRLRSPHNGHLTFLARSGVPGFALWLIVQGSWAWTIFSAEHHARKRNQMVWAGLFLFLLAYWLSFMANSSFDVFLEGPMGGIWMWTLMGIGLACVQIYKTNPEVLLPQFLPSPSGRGSKSSLLSVTTRHY